MKKILIIAVVALAATSIFAAKSSKDTANDVVNTVAAVNEAAGIDETIEGVWFDQKYNCNWVFSLNTSATGLCEIRDASTNEVIYKFTKNSVQNYKQSLTSDGFTISFDCAAANRSYKFTKNISLSKDLHMVVKNSANGETHDTTIVYKSAGLL